MSFLLWTQPDDFIRANTRLHATPLVPEIRLHLANEMVPLWQLTEEELSATGLPPPYWAFAWAGGQALARYVLDHPPLVAGKSVLDFATGSGIAAIASSIAGARAVRATDIDRLATVACQRNAAANGVVINIETIDLLDIEDVGAEVVLAGDICYEKPLAARVEKWLRRLAGLGLPVVIGDPGRTYMPRDGLEKLATYEVQTTREIEDSDVRRTSVWRVLPQ